jgi:type III restriction enzyme
MNTFESEIITQIASLENVVFWHKIIERKGFFINGFINHYPDFLIYTKSGKIILLETKGDHLDGSDAVRKLKLGRIWANKAGINYRYFMVFKENPIKDAHFVEELMNVIKEL